jgi:hypothetical protein
MGFRPNTWTGQSRLDTIESYLAAGPNADTLSRAQIGLNARGLIAEAYHPAVQQAFTAPATSSAHATLVGLREGDRITGVVCFHTTASSGLTLAKAAIWNTAGTLLASSADASTAYNGNTNKYEVISFSSVYTVPADGGYQIGNVYVGTTPPALLRAVSQTGISAVIGSGALPSVTAGSQTDAANVTWVAQPTIYWFAAF